MKRNNPKINTHQRNINVGNKKIVLLQAKQVNIKQNTLKGAAQDGMGFKPRSRGHWDNNETILPTTFTSSQQYK